jgi:tetratricopeptide (TPR) repeat protein
MRGWILLGLSLFVCSVAIPQSAHAQDNKAKARKHFDNGKNLYDAGDFAPALAEFKEAFRLRDDPVFLFNMGQCHSKLGDDSSALHAYRSYLRRKPDAPNRAQVEARIAELEERQGKTAGTANPPPPLPPDTTPSVVRTPKPEPAPVIDLQSTQPPPEPARTPLLKTWWFWTGVGAVVVGGVATAILLSRGGAKNGCDGESLACVRL